MFKIKVLVISAVPWNTSNNFGNSYSNIFSDIKDIEISNVYLSNGFVNDPCVLNAFEINEDMLFRNLLNKKYVVGRETAVKKDSENNKGEKSLIQKIKTFSLNHRFSLVYMCRDFLWSVGKWNSESLHHFIETIKPDVIFAPINGSTYPNNIIVEISNLYNLPIIGYISDDNYTYKQFSLSPLYWIRRFFIRKSVGNLIKKCKILYVISKKQKMVYDRIFNISSKILTKGFCDRRDDSIKQNDKSHIKIVYTGNLGLNRWKSIAKIAREIDLANFDKEIFVFSIYSQTSLTWKMKNGIKGKGVYFKGPVEASQIHDIQKKADILLHVEATDFIHKWDALYGFSTKIIDYFSEGKTIFAYGNADQASISYLKENDAALIATNEKEIRRILKKITTNSNILKEYSEKSYECGKKYHDANLFKRMIMQDLSEIIRERLG